VITLYHAFESRSFRVLWTLEELGLPYQLEQVTMPARKQPGYLAINPLGTVPTFVDGDLRMTESTAICLYLVTKYGPTPLAATPDEGAAYGDFLNFTTYGEATLTFPQTLYVRYKMLEPHKNLGAAADDYKQWFLARLALLEATLETNTYVCAGRFTAADISVSYALKLAGHMGYGHRLPELTKAYWARLQERPGYQRAMARQS
jgi:glutathione S-transferase